MYSEIICAECGGSFIPKTINSTRCSKACISKYQYRRKKELDPDFLKKETERKRIHREANKDTINQKRKDKYHSDEEWRLATAQRKKDQRKANPQPIRLRESLQKKKHRPRIREYMRNRYNSNPEFRLAQVIRVRIRKAVKNKSNSSIELLGTTIEGCRAHLESLFQEGMGWHNHSETGWHIDHIKPCASFDMTDPEQQKLCFHYTNLQPLWAKENLSKGARILD